LRNFLQLLDRNVTRAVKAIGNLERVDALVKQFLRLLQDGSSEHNHASGAISNLVVL